MDGQNVDRVYRVLWDWCVLRLKESKRRKNSHRQELVRTLYRLASTPEHDLALLQLGADDPNFVVAATLIWAFHQRILDAPPCQSRATITKAQSTLQTILRHPSTGRRLLCCEMLRRLARRNRVPAAMMDALDGHVVNILHEQPRRKESVWIVLRYLMQRPVTSLRPKVETFLPCGGLAWAKAIEYLCMLDVQDTLTPRLLAPLPSSYDVDFLVGLWPLGVQKFYVDLIASCHMETLSGVCLLNIIEAISYCNKVPQHIGTVVPNVLAALEGMDPSMTTDYRFRVWDAGWQLMDKVALADIQEHFPRILSLMLRLPEISSCWSKDRIKSVLSKMYQHDPDAFLRDVQSHTCAILDLLPDAMVREHVGTIIRRLRSRCCCLRPIAGQHLCPEIGCVRLICRLREPALKAHQDFVRDHVDVLVDSIASTQPDVNVRINSRQLLPYVPDEMFEACMPVLEDLILQGDVSSMLGLYGLPETRLRLLKYPLMNRVLGQMDIYSDNLRPSAALTIMGRLPDDVLQPVVESLVQRLTGPSGGSTLASIWDATIEDRLFVLKEMPAHVLSPEHVAYIASTFLDNDNKVVARQLAMEIVVKTASATICENKKDWCFAVMAHAPTDHVRHLAFKMLRLLAPASLKELLETHDLHQAPIKYACALLETMDGTFLETKMDFILNLCAKYPHVDTCIDLLNKVPERTLWTHRDRILVIAREQAFRWDALRHVLRVFSNRGVTLAREMLSEYRFTDVLS